MTIKKRAPRFYAEFMNTTNAARNIELSVGWFVFDRAYTTPQGETCAIARAIGKHSAWHIRDALNKTEPSQ